MNQETKLTEKKCVACRGGVPPLSHGEIERYMKELQGGWQVIQDQRLEKEYRFKDFKEALAFTNKVAALAEQEGHHPDILLCWGKVKITLWTHKINGLTESDFIVAAKCDLL